jgi:glycosyltransferase involved in cell wall biosynthesis
VQFASGDDALSCAQDPMAMTAAAADDQIKRRTRVLLLTDRPFIPPVDGSTRVYRAWYDALRSGGADLTVVSFNHFRSRWSAEGLKEIARQGVQIHVFDLYSGRLHATLHKLALLLYSVVTGSTFRPSWLAAGLAADRQRLMRLMAGHCFDVVIIQKIRTLNLLGIGKLISAEALRITDLHDNCAERTHQIRQAVRYIHRSLPRLSRSSIALSERLDSLNLYSRARLSRNEACHLNVSDRICVNDQDDLRWLGEQGIPSSKLVKLPWPTVLPVRPSPGDSTKFDFGFIGALDIFNIEALLHFGKEIWPLISTKRPESTFVVAGHLAKLATLLPRHLFSNTSWLGWVDDVASFYGSVNVVVVPLLSGTGVSIKTLEAAAYGVPIVSTSVGVRGLTLAPDHEVLVRDSPSGFASAALALARDPRRAAYLGVAARSAINLEHSVSRFEEGVRELIKTRTAMRAVQQQRFENNT